MNPMPMSQPAAVAAGAINALGFDLLRRVAKPDANALLSPYSIQCGLAMAYAGAEGDTRAEMGKVLRYPQDEASLHRALAALRRALDDIAERTTRNVDEMKRHGVKSDPITLTVANRLFGQTGYQFREPYLALVKDRYAAPLELLDFRRDSEGATEHINVWVEHQTRQRIRGLIPVGALDELTRLVLVNAIYLKAPWADPFQELATRPLPFHVAGGGPVDVPTMSGTFEIGHSKRDGFRMLAIPYHDDDLQFLVLMPDEVVGLAGLEQKLTPGLLAGGASLPRQEVALYLPKFRLEPPVMSLCDALRALGMVNAFDVPQGSANFDRMAPRRPDDYLFISAVFHKTFLDLDERGTEAAAATSAMASAAFFREAPETIEVRVDRPFVFAIQHRPSGACLFLGHVADPR